MRLATSYVRPGGYYFEFCTRADTSDEAANDIYPDVGCIHQGYDIPNTRAGKPVTQAEARAEAQAKAEVFLASELANAIPMWEGAKVQEERRLRAEARVKALELKLLDEERARLAAAEERARLAAAAAASAAASAAGGLT